MMTQLFFFMTRAKTNLKYLSIKQETLILILNLFHSVIEFRQKTSNLWFSRCSIAPCIPVTAKPDLDNAENTPHIGLDGRGLGFEHPEIRLWCLFWQSVKWGGPCGSCPKMTFNGLEPPSHRQNAQISEAHQN